MRIHDVCTQPAQTRRGSRRAAVGQCRGRRGGVGGKTRGVVPGLYVLCCCGLGHIGVSGVGGAGERQGRVERAVEAFGGGAWGYGIRFLKH
jgi:hypothetical protein